MERKENDLLLNMVANPYFSLEDFMTIGFNMDNTSLQSKSYYKNNLFIQESFQNNGKFDEKAFNRVYDLALLGYNAMATLNTDEVILNLILYHRNNILAPKEKRKKGPNFKITEHSNPTHVNFGMVGPGTVIGSNFSTEEWAQKSEVLLNPVEVSKGASPIWGNSPNDSWFDDFWETRVLALYEEDGEHRDPISGQIVKHSKGDPILNSLGEYYYENLEGRSPYGKIILNKLNTLTEDGSFWNLYDFFDSDDVNLKSITGSILKNAVLVGSMFLPYVGPVITGLSMATLLAGVLATLGKMATGSENAFLSNVEGWSKSVNRQTAKTLYAQEHLWCWENFLNLIGDVAGLLKELRFLFEKAPVILKGFKEAPRSKEAYKEAVDKLANKIFKTKTEEIAKVGILDVKEQVKLFSAARYESNLLAQKLIDSFIKGYDKIGSVLSKGYMTMITVGDTYGDAKLAGASDIEATFLTLGYGAAEALLLNSDIGEWILPELRMNRIRQQEIARALTGIKEVKDTSKLNLAKKLFNQGKQLLNNDVSRITKKWTGGFAAAALGESFEETSEELLADFSKAVFNTINWLRDDDTRMSAFGFTDGTLDLESFNGKEVLDRYSMAFLGGAIGGGLANGLTNYRLIKQYAGMGSELALLELVYELRNGNKDKFLKTVSKMHFGDKHLTWRQTLDQGTYGYLPAESYEDSLDYFIKDFITKQVNTIDAILTANGANLSDASLLNKFVDSSEILKSFRSEFLSNSAEVRRMFNQYNILSTRLTSKVAELTALRQEAEDTNNNGSVEDGEERHANFNETKKKLLKLLEAEVKEIQKLIEGLTDGSRTPEFLAGILYEATPYISSSILPTAFPLFAESIFHKNFNLLTPGEKLLAEEQYKVWKEGEAKDVIHESSLVFLQIDKNATKAIRDSLSLYKSIPENLRSAVDLIGSYFNINAELDGSSFIEGALESVQTTDFFDLLAKELGIDTTPIKNAEQAIASIPVNVTELQKNEVIATNRFIIDNIYLQALKTLVPLFKFINFEVRLNLIRAIDNLEKLRVTDAVTYQNSLPDDDTRRLNNIFAPLESELLTLKTEIERLPSSDIENNLNSFALTVGQNKVNLTGLLALVDLTITAKLDDISKFTLGPDLKQSIDEALGLLTMYRSVIAAARTDNASTSNYFGFNITMNEVLGNDDLATLDSLTADLFIEDINSYINKLQFAKNLYAIALGQKLSRLDTVENAKNILFFDRLRYIVSIDDPTLNQSTDFLSFKALINSLSKHIELSLSRKFELKPLAKEQLEQERLKLEDAIYDLFNNSDGSLKNLDILRKILISELNDPRLNLFNIDFGILNENLGSMDDNSVFWYLATRSALKASTFYNEYNQTIKTAKTEGSKPLAPISTQELAIYTAYAVTLNRLRFNDFSDIYRDVVKTSWANMSEDQRAALLRAAGKNPDIFQSNNMANLIFNVIPPVRYTNMLLVEGIAGSGKTSAVLSMYFEMLKRFHADAPILKNVAVFHGGDVKSAEAILQSNLLVGKAFNRVDGLKLLCSTYVEPPKNNGVYQYTPNDFVLSSSGEYVSTLVPDATTNPFSLIVIDEVTKFTGFELDLINKYALEHGISVITMGDYDLIGVNGVHPVIMNGLQKDMYISPDRLNFIRTPKLGVSIRTNNSLKTENLLRALAIVNLKLWDLKTKYKKILDGSKKGFYGDLMIDPNSTETVEDIIKLMKESLKLGEHIYYYYTDPNSNTSLDIMLKHPDIIPIYGELAQGREALYYIIEANSEDLAGPLEYEKYLYTGITRSVQGSLMIAQSQDPNKYINSIEEDPESEDISDEAVLRYANKKKQLYTKLLGTISTTSKYIAPPKLASTPLQQLSQELLPTSLLQSTLSQSQNGDLLNQSQQDSLNPSLTTNPQLQSTLSLYEEVFDEDDEWDSLDLDLAELDLFRAYLDELNADSEEEAKQRLGYLTQGHDLAIPLYSFNSLESGFSEQNDLDEAPQFFTQEQEQRHARRIDSAHGLLKIDLYLGNLPRTIRLYLLILAHLLNLTYHTANKQELLNKIKNYLNRVLGGQYLPFSNLNIIFAFKSIFQIIDPRQEFPRHPTNLDLGLSEKTYYNYTLDSDRGTEIDSKKLVMVIADEQGKPMLEVPLMKFASPITIGSLVDNNVPRFPLVHSIILKYKAMSENASRNSGTEVPIDFYSMVREILNDLNIKNDPMYHQLYKLFLLFLHTYTGFETIDDITWTPMKDLEFNGIEIKVSRGRYLANDNFIYDLIPNPDQWHTLEELSQNPRIYISRSVYKSKYSTLSRGNQTVDNAFPTGLPYVLMTQDPDLIIYDANGNIDYAATDTYLKEAYIILQLNKNNPLVARNPQRVKLVTVMPPHVSFSEYILNIFNVINKRHNNMVVPVKDLGDMFTALKILNACIQDSNFKLLLDSKGFPRNGVPFSLMLADTLADINAQLSLVGKNSAERRRVIGLPNTLCPLTSSEANISYTRAFERILYDLIYDIPPSSVLLSNNINPTMDVNALNLISSILDAKHLNIFYATRFSLNDTNDPIRASNAVGWSLDGKPFRLSGKLDGLTFTGKMDQLVDKFLRNVTHIVGATGIATTTRGALSYNRWNTSRFVNGRNVNPRESQVPGFRRILENLLDAFNNILGLQLSVTFDDLIDRFIQNEDQELLIDEYTMRLYNEAKRIDPSIVFVELNHSPLLARLSSITRYLYPEPANGTYTITNENGEEIFATDSNKFYIKFVRDNGEITMIDTIYDSLTGELTCSVVPKQSTNTSLAYFTADVNAYKLALINLTTGTDFEGVFLEFIDSTESDKQVNIDYLQAQLSGDGSNVDELNELAAIAGSMEEQVKQDLIKIDKDEYQREQNQCISFKIKI